MIVPVGRHPGKRCQPEGQWVSVTLMEAQRCLTLLVTGSPTLSLYASALKDMSDHELAATDTVLGTTADNGFCGCHQRGGGPGLRELPAGGW